MKVLEEYIKKAMKECGPVSESDLGMDASEAQMWMLVNKGPIGREFSFIETTAKQALKQIKMKKNVNDIIEAAKVIKKTAEGVEKQLIEWKNKAK
jgi:hypothetical protein